MGFLLSTTFLFTLGGGKYKIYRISHILRQSTNFSHFSHMGGGGFGEILVSREGEVGVSRGPTTKILVKHNILQLMHDCSCLLLGI